MYRKLLVVYRLLFLLGRYVVNRGTNERADGGS